jgi:catechol 2,3-dioxygenase-like lactoylglutathione lyase family enzyme
VIKGIRHTGIVVDKLEQSLSFYKDLLGLKIAKRIKEKGVYIDRVLALENVEVTTVKMIATDGQLIELLKYHSHPQRVVPYKICDVGPTHIAFTVDNLGSMYKQLKNHGVCFNSPPCISPDGCAKVVFCRDPEGNFIELVEELKAR